MEASKNQNLVADFLAIFMLAFSLLAFFGVHAATSTRNKPLNYQGRLTNSSYVPVTDGSYNMKFKIYDSASGGSCLWATGSSTGSANCSAVGAVSVSVSRGLFNTLLGDTTVTNMPAMVLDFNSASYYVGVSVGSDAEMTPRQRIGGSPYSYNADELDGLDSTAFLQVGGTAGGQTTYGGSASGENLTLSSTSNSTKGKINLGANSAYDEVNKRLGIGTSTPNYPLEVITGQKPVHFGNTTATGDGGFLYPSGDSNFYVMAGGTWDTDNFYAKSTTFSGINLVGGVFRIFNNSALTPGASFAPNEHFRIGTTGDMSSTGTLTLDSGSNPSTTGTLRLANTDTIHWRNHANDADSVTLEVGTDNKMYFAAPGGFYYTIGSHTLNIDTGGNIFAPGEVQAYGQPIGLSAYHTGADLEGQDVVLQASGNVGTYMGANFTKNDANAYTFSVANIQPTFAFGGSNAGTTVNIMNIDSTNTAVTGVTTNLIKASYGGAQQFNVDSSGNIASQSGQSPFTSMFGGFGNYQNMVPDSENLLGTSWTRNGNTTTTMDAVSPMGVANAAATVTVSSTDNWTMDAVTVEASTQYTASWWVKKGTATGAVVKIYDGTLTEYYSGTYPSSVTTSQWTQVTYTFTTNGNTTVYLAPIKTSSGTGNMYFWGFQMRKGSYAGPYVKTTGTAIAAGTGLVTNSFVTSGNVTIAGALTSTRVNPRSVSMTDASSITPTGDTADINYQANTQSVGTLTVNAPSGTPVDGQTLKLRIKSTNVQTYSWNAIYRGSSTVALPTASSGASKTDYIGFIYNSADSKWDCVASDAGH